MRLGPKIISADLGKNWMKFERGVAKKLFCIYFNMADKHINGKWQMRHRQNRHIAGNQGVQKNSIWTMLPKVIIKRVDFLPTHDPQVALFPTLAWTLRPWCWESVPSLFSIDQSLAEIQPLNQYFSTLLSLQHPNFLTKINKKNLFSKFCSPKSKDHLGQFWKVLD